MKSQKIVFIIVAIIFIAGIILALFFGNGLSITNTSTPEKTLDLPQRNDTVPEVPFLYNYNGKKIVYTTDTVTDKTIYIGDCSTRGGVFNTCGNTCAPGAAMCSDECALTCEIK